MIAHACCSHPRTTLAPSHHNSLLCLVCSDDISSDLDLLNSMILLCNDQIDEADSNKCEIVGSPASLNSKHESRRAVQSRRHPSYSTSRSLPYAPASPTPPNPQTTSTHTKSQLMDVLGAFAGYLTYQPSRLQLEDAGLCLYFGVSLFASGFTEISTSSTCCKAVMRSLPLLRLGSHKHVDVLAPDQACQSIAFYLPHCICC
jgi:hypothetical protein